MNVTNSLGTCVSHFRVMHRKRFYQKLLAQIGHQRQNATSFFGLVQLEHNEIIQYIDVICLQCYYRQAKKEKKMYL